MISIAKVVVGCFVDINIHIADDIASGDLLGFFGVFYEVLRGSLILKLDPEPTEWIQAISAQRRRAAPSTCPHV